MKKIIFILLFLHVVAFTFATTRKVLFIGNSYTYTNNMPLMLQTLTTAMGDTLIYDQSVVGGYTFAMHCTYAPTIAKIFSQQWDIVVLQEQSEMPAFPPSEVDTGVYPYAHTLDSMIHANDTCSQTMFLMTWGHANGDPPNCAYYPVICTYAGMQQRLRESYLQMTLDNHAIVAPVGAAWQVMMDSFASSIWLYISDSSHPAIPGSYLESCVLYSSIFHKPTLGCIDTAGLPLTAATTIQRISDKVVMDSLVQWQQYGHYPYAGFTGTCIGDSAVFASSSTISELYSWSFGDGITISDTSIGNSTHIYSSTGTYNISMTASTNCFTETISKAITCSTTGIGSAIKKAPYKIKVSQQANCQVTFTESDVNSFDVLEVLDCKGALVRKYYLNGNTISDMFVPGLYIIKAYSYKTGQTYCNKLSVY